ncbi:hypothetical protein [Curtobacterium sp. MCBD17_003]|uniref:hypothetical protein n=1 Tax=Curtobacterium sp. MCBD17_003 TaxID=2175667 RepID=UPI000DA74502|nr:hypothetical protein [Curtobacterium sp. MCBD17_003]WIE53728.1 hypothetical protein DEI88_011355 [Curtobacterium sp. MCBD17_003]
MHDPIATAMLVVPQFASVCCVVGDRYRPRPAVVVPALVMLVAMLLPAFGVGTGWSLVAGAALLLVAPLPVIGSRAWAAGAPGRAEDGREARRADPMDVHRALSAVVMAGMLLLGAMSGAMGGAMSGAGSSGASGVTTSGAGHGSTASAVLGAASADPMAHTLVLTAVLGAGVVGYCAFSGWLLRYEWGREDRRAVRSGEVFAMTVAVVGMTLMM